MKSMRRILISAALIATLALTAMAPGASTAPSGYAFPSNIKKSFIKGCMKGGASRAQCKCVIRKFDRRYTTKEFVRVLKRADRTGKFSKKDLKLIRSCRNA